MSRRCIHSRRDHVKSLLAWAAPLLFGLLALPFATAQTSPGGFNTAQAKPETPPVRVENYSIDVVLDPARHSLQAHATVNFVALQPLATVAFQLNPALRVTSITDAEGHRLSAERTSLDVLSSSSSSGQIQVAAATPLTAGQSAAWTFTYTGVFASDEDGAANSSNSTQLAFIGDPVSYLLYRALWFPIAGDGMKRFTASIHVDVPGGERAFGSGLTGTPHADANGRMDFDFEWKRPGFPGTIIAGKFHGPYIADGASNVRVFLIENPAQDAATEDAKGRQIAAIAMRQLVQFTSQFGALASDMLDVIELPNGTVPAYSAPEIAAIADRYLQGEDSARLLANTIAHQWWGDEVTAPTRNDMWITNGMCRYAELEYLKSTTSDAVFSDAILNVSASAIAYDTIPLADAGRYGDSSPEFQAMTYDKGAMIFRMLQWQIGDTAFHETLRKIIAQSSEKSVSTADLEQIAEGVSGQNLRPFFTQWLDSTGAPTLREKWTIYRLGNNKGFRTIGEIDDNLDLFQMPVDVRVQTGTKTINQRVRLEGPASPFVIDTSGMPSKISLDPERRLLRSDPDMQVRVHILRGMNLASEGDVNGAIQEYRRALAIDPISSLASYRLGEAYLTQRNYQAADDAFRHSLDGDGVPRWTEVWSDVQLGKIFDLSGQRDRAVSQYREALQTQDNTGGAVDLARAYLEHPYAEPNVSTR
ncbi:MAG: M1 family aminopeptidase [Acidobacteriaceae bacterium]